MHTQTYAQNGTILLFVATISTLIIRHSDFRQGKKSIQVYSNRDEFPFSLISVNKF